MSAAKKKATAKGSVRFKDLKASKNPKGGFSWGVGMKYTPSITNGTITDGTITGNLKI